MIKTFNRQPLSVNTPDNKDVEHKYLNQYDWKGLIDNKNFLSVDQDSFADCNNVYVDEQGLLRSRPSLKVKTISIVNGEEKLQLGDIVNVWNFVDTIVYESTYNNKYYLTFVNELFPDNNLQIELKYLDNEQYISYNKCKLVVADRKVFVFSEHAFDYYDMDTNEYSSAEKFIYIPKTKIIVDGIEDESKGETNNILTTSTMTSYIYTNFENINFNVILNKKVVIELDDEQYEFEFKQNNQLILVSKYMGLTDKHFLQHSILGLQSEGTPLIATSESTSMLLSSYTISIDEITKVPQIDWFITHTIDGITFNILPKIDNVIGVPKITHNGYHAIVFKKDGPYIYSVIETEGTGEVLSYKYKEWTNLLSYIDDSINWNTEINLNKINEVGNNFNQSVITNGDFVTDDTFTFIYGDYPKEGNDPIYRKVNSISCYKGKIYKNTLFSSIPNGKYNKGTIQSPTFETIKAIPIHYPSSLEFDTNVMEFGLTNCSLNYTTDENTLYIDFKYAFTVNGMGTTITKNIVINNYINETKYVINDDSVVIVILLDALSHVPYSIYYYVSDYSEDFERHYYSNEKYIEIPEDANITSSFLNTNIYYEIVYATMYTPIVKIVSDNKCNVILKCKRLSSSSVWPSDDEIPFTIYGTYNINEEDSNFYIKGYLENDDGRPVINDDISIIENENTSYYSYYRLYENKDYKPSIQLVIYTFNEFNNLTYVSKNMLNNVIIFDEIVLNSYQLNDEEFNKFLNYTIRFSNKNLYLLTNNKLYAYNTYTDNRDYVGIDLLFYAKPISIYFYNNKFDSIYLVSENYLYVSSTKNMKISVLNEGVNKYFLPTNHVELQEHYFSKDKTLYISEPKLNKNKDFIWYLPELKKQEFNFNITNLHPISSTEVAIFLPDEIYYTLYDTNISAYRYYKTKLQVGCKKGCDVITTFDGKYVIFPSERGLVAMSYQQFVATTEQSLTYLSDNIYSIFYNYITDSNSKNEIKLFKHSYWIFVYKQDSKKGFLLDVRNMSWWPIEGMYNTSKFIELEHRAQLLSNNKLFNLNTSDVYYFDNDGKLKTRIKWYIKSQKLHLNALNYYKHIVNMTFASVHNTEALKNSQHNIQNLNLKLQVNNYRKKIDGNIDSVNDWSVVHYNIDIVRTYVQRLNYSKVNEFQYLLSYDSQTALNVPLSLSNITIKYKIGGQIR